MYNDKYVAMYTVTKTLRVSLCMRNIRYGTVGRCMCVYMYAYISRDWMGAYVRSASVSYTTN